MKNKLFVILIVSLLFMGCPPADGSDPDPGNGGGTGSGLYVSAILGSGFSTNYSVNVIVVDNATVYSTGGVMGDYINSATVKLNSDVLPPSVNTGYYTKDYDSFTAESSVNLTVDYSSYNVSETLVFPTAPTLTMAGGTTITGHDYSTPYTITWDSVTPQPDEIEIYIHALDTQSGEELKVVLSAGETSYVIPGGTIKNNLGPLARIVEVRSVRKKSITGCKDESVYKLMNYSNVSFVPAP